MFTPGLGQLKKVKLYTDYSRMMKDKRGWDDSQMFTVGVQFLAMPIMAWVDLTWARNANPFGGAENGTGWTSTSSVGSNDWYYRPISISVITSECQVACTGNRAGTDNAGKGHYHGAPSCN